MNKSIFYVADTRQAVKSGFVSMSALDWKTMFGANPDEESLDEHGAYQAVSWVSRCVQMRCNALSTIPARIYRGRGNKELQWEFADILPNILWMTEGSAQLYGVAYWLREENLVKDKGYRWLANSTIKPKYDAARGLDYFERTLKGQTPQRLEPVKDVLYYWQPNLETETGPGKGWVSSILTESGVAHAVNQFAAGFFERGAITATLLSVEGNPSRDELDRLERWWKRLLQGVRKAWETVAIRSVVKPVQIGGLPKDLAMTELLMRVREQIATAAGVPQTMLEDAANYATAQEHHQAFYTETIVPEAVRIEAWLNRQLFQPQGLRVVLDWQSLDIFQEDEARRAAALGQLVAAGVPLDLAMEILGMDLPNEMTYEQLRGRLLEDKVRGQARALQIAAAQRQEEDAGEQREELRRWQRKALKAMHDGKGAAVEFETDIVGPEDQGVIRERLSAAMTEEEVKAAFAAPFLLKDIPTRDPADPLGIEKDSAEARLIRLLKSRLASHFDAVMQILGDPPNLNNLTPEFWQTEAGRLLAMLSPELEAMAMTSAAASATVSVVWDEAVIAREAVEWARQYAYDLVSQLNRSTLELLQQVISGFLETPGMTIGDLRRELAPAFGERRAQTIAVTETTRAFEQGNQLVQRELERAGIHRVRQWRTAMDEKVCPLCAPLEGKNEGDWGGLPGPPAHPNCRCWTVQVMPE